MNFPESNELVTLTKELDKLFKVSGCDPTCHCCRTSIFVGDRFKLGTVSEEQAERAANLRGYRVFKSEKEHDVMLCAKAECLPEKMIINQVKVLDDYERRGLTPYGDVSRQYDGGGCSIVDEKIVV